MSCQFVFVSDRNTLCDRCYPAVMQAEPHTSLRRLTNFQSRPAPAALGADPQ